MRTLESLGDPCVARVEALKDAGKGVLRHWADGFSELHMFAGLLKPQRQKTDIGSVSFPSPGLNFGRRRTSHTVELSCSAWWMA